MTAGLRLFAHHGFSKTSTRELAEAATVNVAAISYYFGDKAGLYRAVFFEPMGGTAEDEVARFNGPTLSLQAALQGFYAGFLEPLKEGDMARHCMKLHLREMLEPTGLWDHDMAHGIRPLHEALLQVLARHLRVKPEEVGTDTELLSLAICIAGLGVHMHVGRDVIDILAPGLVSDDQSIDVWSQRLVRFGLAMVRAEAQRRGVRLLEE